MLRPAFPRIGVQRVLERRAADRERDLPTGMLGIAWPSIRAELDAPLAGLGVVLAAMTVTEFGLQSTGVSNLGICLSVLAATFGVIYDAARRR